MKVLVTGATGFIGRHLIPALQQRGVQIVTSSVEKDPLSFPWLSDTDYCPFDLRDYSANANLFEYFRCPDFLVHLAWEGLPRYRECFHFEDNLPRHYAFLKNLITHGLSDITVTGTCLEYGMCEGCLEETMPACPSNAYALAKNTLYKFLQELKRTIPFCLKWPRLFYLYGPGQSPRALLAQLDQALESNQSVFNMSGGEQQRDYLPIEVAVEKLVCIATQQKVTGVINCCSGHPIKVKELVLQHLIKRERKIELNLGFYPYPDFEPMNFWGSTVKYSKILR